MTPTFRTSGNARSWQLHSGSKAQSSLGGAFENARIIARIGMGPALGLFAFFAIFAVLIAIVSPAASVVTPPTTQHNASPVEARSGGKVQP